MRKVYLLVQLLFLSSTLFISQSLSAHGDDDCTAHPTDPEMHDEHCAVFALVPEDEATVYAVSNGNWFSGSTWNTGTVPTAGAKVLIDSGYIVTYNGTSETEIFWLRVNGTLNFSTDIDTKLKLNTFIVDVIGTVSIGTSDTPVSSSVSAQIIFTDNGPIDTDWDPHFFSKGMVCHGTLTCYGQYKKAYCQISQDMLAGSNVLKTYDEPDSWEVGDQLVLTGTKSWKGGNNDDNSLHQDELLTITSISGKNIYFTNNKTGGTTFSYDHKTPAAYNMKYYAANLTRNIIFETENWQTIPISERAHVMLMHNVNQNVSYAAFNGLGRTNKLHFATDPVVNEEGVLLSGGENPRGRYSLHIHKAGTNNPLADPVNILGCVIYNTPGWGVVNHASNAVIEDCVVYEFNGSAFVTEEGNELGAFNRNIAIKGIGVDEMPPGTSEIYITSRALIFDLAFEGDGFWIKSTNIELENNIAASCAGTGFNIFVDDDDMPVTHHPKIPAGNILNPNLANGDDSISAAIVPFRKNNNSQVFNSGRAMNIWTFQYNADNIGDFSNAEYEKYSHDILSVVSNFKFWNILSEGIRVSYSSQVYFKDGYLLGDLDGHFQSEDWYWINDDSGQGILGATVSGQFVYDNLTVAGWNKAMVVYRTDDSNVTDDDEYNYRTSKLIGGVYENNLYNMYPEKGIDDDFSSENYVFGKYFEISGSPSFSVFGANSNPTAEYSYTSKGGTSVQFNGSLSFDADASSVTTGGNGIAAYAWDFGDGTVGYGSDIIHHYSAAGTYSASLTVYDCQGQTNVITKNVYVTDNAYSNIIINPGFESAGLTFASTYSSIDEYVNIGWMQKDEWSITNGKASIGKAVSENKPLVQIIKNDFAMQGEVEFSFQAKNLGLHATSNDLIVEIIGVNDDFFDANISVQDNLTKRYSNDNSFDRTILLNENFGLSEFDWQTFKRTIDFGDGYRFILVKYYSYGLKPAKNDDQGLDNICLPCVCQIPASIFETTVTSTAANLVWDNVGAENYKLQIKQGSGAWTSYTVDNTFLFLNDLIPNKTYQWKVSAECESGYTAYTPVRKFTTPVSGSGCTNPTITSASLITSQAATISWNEVPGAVLYQLSYKKTSGGSWVNINTSNTSYRISGLVAGSNYQYRVRTQCAEGWKAFTAMSSFNTLALKEGVEEEGAQPTLEIYPNPADEYITISSDIEINHAEIEMFDMAGRSVFSQNINDMIAGEAYQIQTKDIARGMYLLKITSENKASQSVKVMIE